MNACIQIGHSDVFCMWMDGNLIAYSDSTEHWTPENIHKLDVPLKKGMNRIVLKLANTNGSSDFSMLQAGPCTAFLTNLGSGRI